MTARKRQIWIGLAGFVGVAAIGLAIFTARFDQKQAKDYIAAAVSKATGRQLNINGDLKLHLGWISKVSASQIEFANADWSKRPQMAEIGNFDLEIDLWELITKFRLIFPTVTISQPKVVLEKDTDGSANWDFRAGTAVTDAVTPQKRTEFPVIQKLVIKDGLLSFDNRETKTQMELKVTEAEGGGFLEQPVKLKAEGTYQKLPIMLSLDGGSYENLRNSKAPYPLRIDFSAGKLKAKINGNLTEPLEVKGEDVTLDIQGDDMAKLYPLIHLVFPTTPPYRLKGHLRHEGNVWSFENFSGRVGDSDLSGNIRVDTAPKRPFLNGRFGAVSTRMFPDRSLSPTFPEKFANDQTFPSCLKCPLRRYGGVDGNTRWMSG